MAYAQEYPATPPAPPPPEVAFRAALDQRPTSDYRCDFWTAFGWGLLTCGIFWYYTYYQMARRIRDHNVRKLQLLEAANAAAWRRAGEQGLQEELRPQFERVASSLSVLRAMTSDFRDPAIWIVLILVSSGIGLLVLFVLLDGDLIRHRNAEASAEAELAAIWTRLGRPVTVYPPAPPKNEHNYGGRIVAYIASCGFYILWWTYDLMREGNLHFDRDAAAEDTLARAVLAP